MLFRRLCGPPSVSVHIHTCYVYIFECVFENTSTQLMGSGAAKVMADCYTSHRVTAHMIMHGRVEDWGRMDRCLATAPDDSP